MNETLYYVSGVCQETGETFYEIGSSEKFSNPLLIVRIPESGGQAVAEFVRSNGDTESVDLTALINTLKEITPGAYC